MTMEGSNVCFLGFLFLRSAWMKFKDPRAFETIFARYPLAGRLPSTRWAIAVPLYETIVAAFLLVPAGLVPAGVSGALALVIAGSAGIGWRRLRGESHFACGCEGSAETDEETAGAMLLRNALLCGLLASVLKVAPALRQQGFDYLGGLALLLAWDLLRSAMVTEGRVHAWKARG